MFHMVFEPEGGKKETENTSGDDKHAVMENKQDAECP